MKYQIRCDNYIVKEKEGKSMKSIVKWFDNDRGYGFVEYKNNDILVHYKSIISDAEFKTLLPGEYVEFELVHTKDGDKAKNLKSFKEDI